MKIYKEVTMSNNKQSSVDWLKDQLEHFGNKHELQVSWATVDELVEQAKAMHKEEHSQTWDKSMENYESRGGNDMRSWVDFDAYYKETYESNS